MAGLLEWTWLPWLPGDVLNIPVPETTEVPTPLVKKIRETACFTSFIVNTSLKRVCVTENIMMNK